MAIYDIFSKREKRNSGQRPDVFIYDQIPDELRVQMVHMIRDVLGNPNIEEGTLFFYEDIKYIACREYGLFDLCSSRLSYDKDVFDFLLESPNTDRVLDIIEWALRISKNLDAHVRSEYDLVCTDEIVAELNQRFLEHSVGYQFESGKIIRIDSQFVHSEVVKPVLGLLSDPLYTGANEEFLAAHEHYRHGRHKPCIVESLKAFESTMKIICKKRGWNYNETDTAKKLINACLTNNLISPSHQTQFASLRSVLESGIPTLRNKQGGHGQGHKVRVVPAEITRYALNLTASNILFLIESEKALP